MFKSCVQQSIDLIPATFEMAAGNIVSIKDGDDDSVGSANLKESDSEELHISVANNMNEKTPATAAIAGGMNNMILNFAQELN